MSNWNQQQFPAYPPGGSMPIPTGQYPYPPQPQGAYPPYDQPPQGYPAAHFPGPYTPQPSGYAYPPQAGYGPQPNGYSLTPPQQQQMNPTYNQGAYPPQFPQGQYPPGAYPTQPMAAAPCCDSQDEPTLRPFTGFNPEADAKALNKAMKGIGTDEKAIIAVLGNRSITQRLQIVTIYKTLFGKDLINHLKSELSGNFEDVVIALLQPPEVFDAYTLHDAVCGAGTKEEALIEVILSRSNAEIHAVKQTYKALYKKDLEKDVMDDTSGYFKRILVACLQGNRQPENQQVDHKQAHEDAKALYEAGPKKWGTDEATFIGIFALRSFTHLRCVFDEFKKIANKDIESVIKSEMSGNLEASFLALAKIAKNKHAYFAERLYTSMKGAGTHDKRLIRVVVTRCEKDMNNIRKEFVKMYGKTLESFISDDCSGDYKRMLLALVNPGSR